MKISRNSPCPCGSGKKYKKCCLLKSKEEREKAEVTAELVDRFIDKLYEMTQEEKVKNEKLHNRMKNIMIYHERLNEKKLVRDYLEVINSMVEYAKKHDIHSFEELDECMIIGYPFESVIDDFEIDISNVNVSKDDLIKVNESIDQLIANFDLDDNSKENLLRCKVNNLFRMGNDKEGEQIILDWINTGRHSIFSYVELIDDYKMIGNLKKAKYYYDEGLKQKHLEDLDAISERSDYFEKITN